MSVNVITTDTPALYYGYLGASVLTLATLPTGVTGRNRRPSHIEYKKRHYFAGQFSANLIFTEFQTVHTLGIRAPVSAPTIATTGAGVVTGSCVGYISFLHKNGTTTIAESNLSPASTSVTFASQQRRWTLPTTGADTRVTHVRLYAAMDGALPRIVSDQTYGTASFDDNVATLALGAPPPLNAAGEVAQNRGVPPYTRFVELYHDRAWWAGDPNFPARVWFSEVAEPEGVGALSFIDTRDGETITGLKRIRDQLLIFCQRVTYAIQGYSAADFVMYKISPTVGCVSHFAIVNIHNRLWFPAEDGVYVYDGGFTFMMEDLRDYFRDDFLANKAAYLDSIATEDRFAQVYKLLVIKGTTPFSFYYVGTYDQLAKTGQPRWTFDVRAREDTTIGELSDGYSAVNYVGNCDGYVRKENVAANADDDGDTYAKALTIRHGHMLMGDPGKSIEEGKSFVRTWTYVESENNAWILYLLAGDEQSWQGLNPDNITRFWKDSVAASASAGFVPKSVHLHIPERVSGRGLTVKITATSPVGMVFRGYGGEYVPGPAYRRPA